MELADVVCQRAEVTVRNVPSGAIIINLSTGQCWQINRIGADVLQEIGTGRTVGEICNSLGGRYEVSRDVLERDICQLAEELLQAGVIDRTRQPSGGSDALRDI